MFNPTTLQIAPAWLVALIIFCLIILFYLIGHFFQAKRNRKDPELAKADLGKMSGILIGLLAFLLAFTFGMSNSRYDKRRELTIEEANDISTAYLRTKAYPDSLQKLLTPAFNEYLEARIAFSTANLNETSDLATLERDYLKADSIGKKIWDIAVSYVPVNSVRVTASQLLPALNAMIDITTSRRAAGEETVPDPILYFLFILSFCASFLLGYETRRITEWVILTVYAVMISLTIFIILDLDRPRSGIIKMERPIQKVIELRGTFN
jgi:hypothetical protein